MSKPKSGLFNGTEGAKRLEENDFKTYNDADSDKVGIVEEINEIDISNHENVPTKGTPNSVLIIIKRGNKIRERYFDEDGNPYLDIDII